MIAIPVPENVTGRIGYVCRFSEQTTRRLTRAGRKHAVPGIDFLLDDAHQPHVTLCHGDVRGAKREELEKGLRALQERARNTCLLFKRTTFIGGRFQVFQDTDPAPSLQLAAILAALIFRPFLDKEATAAVTQEGLAFPEGRRWCQEQFGHPLAVPSVTEGEYARRLHASFGYWSHEVPFTDEAERSMLISAKVEEVCLAEMGPRGVVGRLYNFNM